ncbi:MAG: hypothetical protein KKG87_01395 [Elusimicrobia bacterium]|nr:hypothetical protein [Elusimicrobiota bacterium]
MIDFIINWLEKIRLTYNVNPRLFAVDYAICVPPFWFAVYKVVAGLRIGKTDKLLKWFLVLGFTLIAPFLYIAFFGKNLPGWFWIAVLVFVCLSILSLIKTIRGKVQMKIKA